MSWMRIVAVLLQALLPVLKEWIENLLKASGAQLDKDGKLSPDVLLAPKVISTLIAEARANLTLWQWLCGGGRSLTKLEAFLHSKTTLVESARRGISYRLPPEELAELRGKL